MSTNDPDKIRMHPLDEKSNCTLWRIRIRPAICAKGWEAVLRLRTFEEEIPTATPEMKSHASKIIVNALSDDALCVVRSVIEELIEMLEMLDDLYDSKSTSAKILNM